MPDSAPVILRADSISKRFGHTRALDDVTVSFAPGEVHALMGENGAGKSTLGKVIAGLHRADSGSVTIFGVDGMERVLRPGSIEDAFRAGIRIVHQELAQCPNLTVAENLCLHDIPRTRFGAVDDRAMTDRAAALLADLEPSIDPRAPLGRLSPGHRQIVQIASALTDQTPRPRTRISSPHPPSAIRHPPSPPRVIVFDEPTSSLSIAEVDRLLAIIRRLAARGITCIYVSHRMSEIYAACNRVTVLRDGRVVATNPVATMDEPTLVEQMIGRKVPPPARRRVARTEGAAGGGLVVRDLDSPGRLERVSFSVAPGEILGIGGLVGAGRSELLDAVFGLDRAARGTVVAGGVELCDGAAGHRGPRASIAAHMGYVPEDRSLQGLFGQLRIGENIAVPVMARLAHRPRAAGVRNLSAERGLVAERVREFEVRAASPDALPGSLSGGNQQKLLLARWLAHDTRVLLLDEPTRGIDVGTKAQVHTLIRAAAAKGLAVVFVSSEMPELLALSDRVIVLAGGKMRGELREEADLTQGSILRLATAR